MRNRKNKGEYGYRNYRRKVRTVMVAVGVTAILVQLAARGLTDNQAARSILMVMAVLSVLPIASLASPLLAPWRYRTPSEASYQKVQAHEEEFTTLYDLIVTTKENTLPFGAMIIHPNDIYAYCTANKVDSSKAERSLSVLLEGQKLDGNLKIIKDEEGFFHRMEGLKPTADHKDDGSVDYTASSLKNMPM